MDEFEKKRTFTEKGLDLFQDKISRYQQKFSSLIDAINASIRDVSVHQSDIGALLKIKKHLQLHHKKYTELSDEFIEFLHRNTSEESSKELASHNKRTNDLSETLKQAMETISHVNFDSASDQVERMSRTSRSSTTSSVMLKIKAKAEGAKVRLLFAKKESELKIEQAEKEATIKKQQVELAANLDILTHEKAVAEAEAEWSAVQEIVQDNSRRNSDPDLPNSTIDKQELTSKYVDDHASRLRTEPKKLNSPPPRVLPDNHVEEFRRDGYRQEPNNFRRADLDVNASEFVPADHTSQQTFQFAAEFSKFLLRKDLLLLRLTNFNDEPSTYHMWKASFKSVVSELQASPIEEFDLLVKWLGSESSKHAISLRSANGNNPARGLERLWCRLDERYGSPEMVETAIKSKLMKFGKLGYQDLKKLYELADILCEIESLKEDRKYSSVLAYFDSSTGINPIVQKLPFNMQGKWTDRAARYKREHDVSFPPFTYFVEFIQSLSSIMNDPSFNYDSTTTTTNAKAVTGRSNSYQSQTSYQRANTKPTVSARKTEVAKELLVQPSESETEDSVVPYCPLHKAHHTLNKCRSFKLLPIRERKEILFKSKFCFRCCESNKHTARDCKKVIRCSECDSSRHTSAMHYWTDSSTTADGHAATYYGGESRRVDVSSKCSQVCGANYSGKSCAKTILVDVYPQSHPEKAIRLYAIIDDQSNRTLAKSQLFDIMGIDPSRTVSYSLSSCNGAVMTSGRQASDLVVESVTENRSFELPVIIECDQIPNVKEEIPSPNVVQHHTHLRHLANKIPYVEPDYEILLLIGRDLPEAHHVLEQCTGPRGSPFAQRLPLGWVIVGEVCLGEVHQPRIVNVNKTTVLKSGRPTYLDPCTSSFCVKETASVANICLNCGDIDINAVGATVFQRTKDDDKVGLSVEDRLFLQLMDKEFTKDAKGNWTAPLPFKPQRQTLPNNKRQALQRAKLLDKSLRKNPQKKQDFVDFMKEIFEKGHAEIAPPMENNTECWYLPIFGVYHPKKPTQLRGVFDSSAVYEGVSLNNVLMTGPDMTNNLLGVLLQFRKDRVAIMADIQKMFYSFYVKDEYRNFLRFFWYKDNNTDAELMEYRMCVHVFGNSPSPAVASYGLRKTVENCEKTYGSDVKEFVNKNFYVDDALVSVQTSEQAVSLVRRTQDALQSGGHLRLHKIASNKKEVMTAFPQEDLVKDLKSLNIAEEYLPLQSSLGLSWDLNSDAFTFNLHDSQFDKPFTRRGLLSAINSVYDPLGFLVPMTIQGKLILRELSSHCCEWDEELPIERQGEWKSWIKSLQEFNGVQIPRSFVSMSLTEAVDREINVFSDASEAIAAVAYVKVKDEQGSSHVGFIMGKAKVAPSHGNTVPRLELCAAVLAIDIGEFVSEHLDIAADAIRYHTDSKVVLGYIRNETRRFYTYVSNRVERIRRFSNPDQWTYVHTDINPADVATRSSPKTSLNSSIWLSGQFQLNNEDTVLNHESYSLVNPESDKELRPEVTVSKTDLTTCAGSLGVQRFLRFSSWKKLVKAIALLTSLARHAAKGEYRMSSSESRTVQDRLKAEHVIQKEVQFQVYTDEILNIQNGKPLRKQSSIMTLNPFLDTSGLLRVGGRINNSELCSKEKNPLIIPGKSHIARLLIVHFHESVKHQGRHFTEGAIRSHGYWITGAKKLISSVLHNCVTCRKLRASFESQQMANLPADRLTPGAPFTSVGVDTFGPWSIVSRKTRGGQANSKRWAVLFTCLTTRAVHIEVVEELSSSSFINALKRFTAIRGKVTLFRSDRGTNFVGATDNLQIDAVNVEDGAVKEYLYNSGCTWVFNPPHSSHMGGVWERMIGVARRILDSLLKNVSYKNLTHEVLSTFMSEVSAIINARPITPVSVDPECAEVLSPSMLLTYKSDTTGIPSGEFELPDMYKAQWKRVQALADVFWRRWRTEYLQLLQTRRKWTDVKPNLKTGAVVLLKDDSVHRNEWPMGRIVNAIPSDDGLVRKVEVRIFRNGRFTTYTRPVTEVVLLL